MHFLLNLITRMLPVQVMVFGEQEEQVPPGFDRVITSRGNFVVTSRGNFVIAKAN